MTRYDYKAVRLADRISSDIQSILTEHGNDGWRLVHTIQTMGYTVQLVFERPRKEAANV